jgi:hypothetical protein
VTQDGHDEVIVLWSGGNLGVGISQIVIYAINMANVGNEISVYSSSPTFTGTGTSVAVVHMIPEPAAASILLGSLAVMAARRRRNRLQP